MAHTDLPDTRIGVGAVIDGDLIFAGRLVIDGRVTGNVVAASGSTHSTLTLSEGASIDGDVQVFAALVLGRVGGVAHVTDRAELAGSARIMGGLQCRRVEMRFGAFVAGDLTIHDVAFSEPFS